jgi:putative transposase
MSNATFYTWRAKYSSIEESLTTRVKEVEDKNRRRQKMYADDRLRDLIVAETLTDSGSSRPRSIWHVKPWHHRDPLRVHEHGR